MSLRKSINTEHPTKFSRCPTERSWVPIGSPKSFRSVLLKCVLHFLHAHSKGHT